MPVLSTTHYDPNKHPLPILKRSINQLIDQSISRTIQYAIYCHQNTNLTRKMLSPQCTLLEAETKTYKQPNCINSGVKSTLCRSIMLFLLTLVLPWCVLHTHVMLWSHSLSTYHQLLHFRPLFWNWHHLSSQYKVIVTWEWPWTNLMLSRGVFGGWSWLRIDWI